MEMFVQGKYKVVDRFPILRKRQQLYFSGEGDSIL